MIKLFPFEEDLIEKTGSSRPKMTWEEWRQNNWKKTNEEKLIVLFLYNIFKLQTAFLHSAPSYS